MMLGARFGPGPFSLDTAIETTHLQIILEVNISQEGGGGGTWRNVPRAFFQRKSIDESSAMSTQFSWMKF